MPALPADSRARLARSLRAEALERANSLSRADHARRGLALHRSVAAVPDRVPTGTARHALPPSGSAALDRARGGQPAGVRGRPFRAGPVRPCCAKRASLSRRSRAALAQSRPVLAEHLGRYADFRDEPFAAVNTAWLQDGALIARARSGRRQARCTCSSSARALRPPAIPACWWWRRRGSDCTVIEDFVALHDGSLPHQCGDRDRGGGQCARAARAAAARKPGQRFTSRACSVRLARDAAIRHLPIALGARISRYNLDVVQAGEGAECRRRRPGLDRRPPARRHAQPPRSHAAARPQPPDAQVHRRRGGARRVQRQDRGAPGRAAHGIRRSRAATCCCPSKAHVDTKPQLEIFADDVKCAHGAAIGQLDAEQVFYLKSRGLSEVTRARSADLRFRRRDRGAHSGALAGAAAGGRRVERRNTRGRQDRAA